MKAIDKLKEQWNQNPLAVITVGALAATAAAKLITSISETQGRRAYAQQIKWKIKNN